MPCVHRLKHVERFAAAHFANDDAFRAHAQTVTDEIARGHFTFPLDVWRSCFQSYHVRLTQLQLRRVLDRDDAFAWWYEARENIEQCRLAGAGAARHYYVEPRTHDRLQHACDVFVHRTQPRQVLDRQQFDCEATNRHHGPVDREWWDDGVDARPVFQARIDHR